ncbi:hypothetical protein [Nocardioides mesophilus]|uniref:FUSC family protein n=1 Tax=Nocardioides mesophilus TaxID=433659 RepID=A0A7G9R6U3_9ACTN|nr:hypothetical protein [Nocardioides mesophilus]QNN51318.1 hypothetical protein H9L09_11855 [Nocardioides mesophilus]
MSVKTALAAAIAWLLVQPLWGVADQYPYYAPLGAVIAVTTTVAGSIRETMTGLAAILVGALLALSVRLTDLPVVVDIGIVVGIGTVLSGLRWFGAKAAWVPITGLFVLIIGRQDAVDYTAAYLGLTGLGAGVGIAVNVAFPPLALTPMADSISRLRGLLAAQLDELAEGLLHEEPLTSEQWHHRQKSIRPTTEEMQKVIGHATDARRANWRARRWSETAELRYQQSRSLQHVAFLIEDMTSLVVDRERAERDEAALGPRLRPYAAHALLAMAEVLRSVRGQTAGAEELQEADAAVGKLVEEIRKERDRSATDLFAAGTVVTGVRRAMASLVPEDLRDELPSDW